MDNGQPLGHNQQQTEHTAFFDYYNFQQQQPFIPDELSLLLSCPAAPWVGGSDRANKFARAPTPPPSIMSHQDQLEQDSRMEDVFLNAVPPADGGEIGVDYAVDLTGLALAELDRLASEYKWDTATTQPQQEEQQVDLASDFFLNLTNSPPTTEAPSSIFDLSPDLGSWASPSTIETAPTPSTVASTGSATLPPPQIATPQRSASNGSQVSAASAPSALERRKNSIGTKKVVEKKSAPRLIAARPILPKPEAVVKAEPAPTPKPVRPIAAAARKVSIKKPRKVGIRRESDSSVVKETQSPCSDALALAAAYFSRGTAPVCAASPMEMELDASPSPSSSSTTSHLSVPAHANSPFEPPVLERAPPAPPAFTQSTVTTSTVTTISTTHTTHALAPSASPSEEKAASPMAICTPAALDPVASVSQPPIKNIKPKPAAARSTTLPLPSTKPRALAPQPRNSPLARSIPIAPATSSPSPELVSTSVPRSFHSPTISPNHPLAGLSIPGPTAPPQPVRASSVPEPASILSAPLLPSAESALSAARKASLANLAAALARGASTEPAKAAAKVASAAAGDAKGGEYNLPAAWFAAAGSRAPGAGEGGK